MLDIARWWVDGTQNGGVRQVGFSMNTDLSSRAISPEALNAYSRNSSSFLSGLLNDEHVDCLLCRGQLEAELLEQSLLKSLGRR